MVLLTLVSNGVIFVLTPNGVIVYPYGVGDYMQLSNELVNDVFLIAAMFYAAEHILKLLDLTIEICINRIKKHFNENKK